MDAYLQKFSSDKSEAVRNEEQSCQERKSKILVRSDSSLDEQIKADLKSFKDQEWLLSIQDNFLQDRQEKLRAIHDQMTVKEPPLLGGRARMPNLRNHQVSDLLLVDQDAVSNHAEETPVRNNNDSLERLDFAAQTPGSNKTQPEEPENLLQYLPCLN
mmetsp:Transcript_15914/g.24570  ORF Transcript_15914/g.24570 Transcript_15914/m.24570 type:complete len:158 (-) Transcript_15914:1199-1672(-)